MIINSGESTALTLINTQVSFENKMDAVIFVYVLQVFLSGVLLLITVTEPYVLGAFCVLSVIAGYVIIRTTRIASKELQSIFGKVRNGLHRLSREKEKLRRRLTKVGKEKQELLKLLGKAETWEKLM